MYFPLIEENKQSRSFIQAFRGYNNNLRIGDDEFSYTHNISCEDYPLLTTRKARKVEKTLESARGLIAKDALVWINGTELYYNGDVIGSLMLNDKTPKQIVSMGAYICIFPDKVWLNTTDLSCGSMEAEYDSEEYGVEKVTVRLTRQDGTPYENVAITEPESPNNGDYWIDTTGNTHILNQWSSTTSMWVQIPTVYAQIEATGIGEKFQEGDGVFISELSGMEQIEALNGSRIIEHRDENSIVVIGIVDQIFETESKIKVSRRVPDLDYVTEAGNRLWGCYYGNDGTSNINEIYCCKLGDFKNWECYQGISTDSWRASVGTDGKFTGAITHLGYPLLFKENCFHKIYVSPEGAHQVVTVNARGIQDGSWQSAVIVNEMLYYKSRTDVCVYDGSLPQGISDVFGDEKYKDASAGAIGSRYYISMDDTKGESHLFVYDIEKGVWMREDNTKAAYFTKKDDVLYMISDNKIVAAYGENGDESDIEWSFITGNIGYDTPDKKYLSRFNLRLSMDEGAEMNVAMQYDSSGVWEDRGTIRANRLGTFTLPIVPKRCDHCQIKIYGTGNFKLYSIAKVYEQGSDV